ncbi:nucleotidyltransferase family protein [Bacillus cereus]
MSQEAVTARLLSLGEEDLFFFLVVHEARHGWFHLRWLKDIDLLIR